MWCLGATIYIKISQKPFWHRSDQPCCQTWDQKGLFLQARLANCSLLICVWQVPLSSIICKFYHTQSLLLQEPSMLSVPTARKRFSVMPTGTHGVTMDEDFGTCYLADDYLTNTKPVFPETSEDDTDSKVLFFGIS